MPASHRVGGDSEVGNLCAPPQLPGPFPLAPLALVLTGPALAGGCGAGTQPATTLVMSKRGIPQLNQPSLRGDQLVRVQVEIPKRLSPEERKLVEELRDINKVAVAR